MVIFTLRVVLRKHQLKEVTCSIRSLLEPTRVKAGCLSCRLYQDIEDPNALTLVEEWECRTDLDKHIRSREYKKVLAAMDLSHQPPEIAFRNILKTDGLRLIEEVLTK